MAHRLTFSVGEEDAISVSIKDSEGDPVDLTGLGARWRAHDGDEVRIDKEDGDGIEITSAEDGELEITLEADDLEEDGRWTHELRISGTGYAETVMRGDLIIEESLFE